MCAQIALPALDVPMPGSNRGIAIRRHQCRIWRSVLPDECFRHGTVPSGERNKETVNMRDQQPTRPVIMRLRCARHCVASVTGDGVGQTSPFGAIFPKLKKCASFPDSAPHLSFRPMLSTASTVRACDKNRTSRPLVLLSQFSNSSAIRRRAFSGDERNRREGRRADSVRPMAVRSMLGVPAPQRLRSGTRPLKYRRQARFVVKGGCGCACSNGGRWLTLTLCHDRVCSCVGQSGQSNPIGP
jgi:hypothetical protein